MEIKHIHPAYESEEARLERLREVRRVCAEKISAIRSSAPKQGGGKA